MQLSIRIAAFASIIFAAICLWFAVDGFGSLGSISDPEEAAGARDFAWFWLFLAFVGAAIAWVSWYIAGVAEKSDT